MRVERKAGTNARFRPFAFALDNLQGPPETNGGTNAPPVPLFREVPGQSRRLAFPCLQYTHAIRRRSEKFMRPYPISVLALAGGWAMNGIPLMNWAADSICSLEVVEIPWICVLFSGFFTARMNPSISLFFDGCSCRHKCRLTGTYYLLLSPDLHRSLGTSHVVSDSRQRGWV